MGVEEHDRRGKSTLRVGGNVRIRGGLRVGGKVKGGERG